MVSDDSWKRAIDDAQSDLDVDLAFKRLMHGGANLPPDAGELADKDSKFILLAVLAAIGAAKAAGPLTPVQIAAMAASFEDTGAFAEGKGSPRFAAIMHGLADGICCAGAPDRSFAGHALWDAYRLGFELATADYHKANRIAYLHHASRAEDRVRVWNTQHGSGTRILYRPVAGDPKVVETRTRSEAWSLHGHVVVMIDGVAGCVSLSHCSALEPPETA